MGLSLGVKGLKWSFPGSTVPFLDIESLTLHGGEFLAVTGPSGAGKSTLLHVLAGLEAAARGSLTWGTQDLGMLSATARDHWRRHHVGIVFQDFQLVPELTALQNVLLPLTFEHWFVTSEQKLRARELLESLGVNRWRALASELSRGEMQRTALARAVFLSPSVILADEPTASLDAVNEAVVSQLLVDHARQEGITVVVATHQPLLMSRADRCLRLEHGRLAEAQK